MRKYAYEGKEYDSLWGIRNIAPNLIFSDDAPEGLLAEIGIAVTEIPEPEPDPEKEARRELEMRLAQIDAETSGKILAGFDYVLNGESLHFSYDSFDQQNFADTANACLLAKSGVAGLPESVTWNGYRADGTLVRLELTADEFLALYTAGALAHKAVCMEAGGAKKAVLMAQAKEPANAE